MGRASLVLLRPFFRHSVGRDAYVLRIVGRRYGPVLREADGHWPLSPDR